MNTATNVPRSENSDEVSSGNNNPRSTTRRSVSGRQTRSSRGVTSGTSTLVKSGSFSGYSAQQEATERTSTSDPPWSANSPAIAPPPRPNPRTTRKRSRTQLSPDPCAAVARVPTAKMSSFKSAPRRSTLPTAIRRRTVWETTRFPSKLGIIIR